MVTISLIFAFLAGLIATFSIAKNNSLSVQSISYLILGVIVVDISATQFTLNGESNLLIPGLLWSTLVAHFIIGEITKNKISLIWNIIPLIFATSTLFLFELKDFAYSGYSLEGNTEFFLIAFISALTPFLTHLAKLGIGILVIRFGKLTWAENEENYLESLVSYAFIGGVAALGNFLLGGMGIVVAASFYLSASFIARNKLGLKNDIILAASGAMFLIITIPILLDIGDFDVLNVMRGEVIEGAFVAGFMIIVHELFMKLARYNQGKWRFIFTFIAIALPSISILALGFAYLSFERLGGILSLGGIVFSMAVISVIFTLFKNSSFINLKLITVSLVFLISPYIKPVERESNIDLSELGITEKKEGEEKSTDENDKEAEVTYQEFSIATGKWVIDDSSSKIYFELGPDDGRTKGEFKSLSGNITIAEALEKSTVNVTLKLKDLTTYITPRDEELMGKNYFNAKKFPEISFVSSSAAQEGENLVFTGDFTMMGVTKTIDVILNLVGKGDQDGKAVIVLNGNSKIDRTDYGQSSSSKIGDIVDFEIEVQAHEK
jgi:polyisoprenoid-binding protein YceI